MSSRLLVVDDDKLHRAITKEMLETSGYQIETAADGLIAWQLINNEPSKFDLILLDKEMPNLDGIGLLKLIRADARFIELPVIMFTAASRQEDIAECLSEGAYYYLTKPTPKITLEQVIKCALDDQRQKQELNKSLATHKNNLKLMSSASFTLRTLSEANELAMLLADFSMTPSKTLAGYFELLVNAIEHGNLNISYDEKSQLLMQDRWLEEVEARLKIEEYAKRKAIVTIEKTDTECIVTITDQGNGFDWQNYVDFTTKRASDLHGRGIAMSKLMSFDSLEFFGCGNQVKATVHLQ
jgi:CheY-like chemotaxis protein